MLPRGGGGACTASVYASKHVQCVCDNPGPVASPCLRLHFPSRHSCHRSRWRPVPCNIESPIYCPSSAMAAAEGTALAKVAALLEERAYDQLGAVMNEAELEVRRSGAWACPAATRSPAHLPVASLPPCRSPARCPPSSGRTPCTC